MPTFTIVEQSLTGKPTDELTFELLTESITVRELIRAQVYQRVQDHCRGTAARVPCRLPWLGEAPSNSASRLVEPTDAERTLNAYPAKADRQIDWRPEFEKACKAFEKNQLLVIADDRQVTELDDVVTLRHDSRVAFVRLVPLIGG